MKQYGNMIPEKNKLSWNKGSDDYSAFNHSEKFIKRIIENPADAFHHTVWELIREYVPGLADKKICVPSSGDNLAVFAFAMLGARVTSCDIAENQLANAARIAGQYGLGKSIEFVCADTMKMDGIRDNEYDFVYTSNGVHVWINDLPGMYRSIYRIMKPDAVYIMYEIHPFLRPFDDDLNVKKPYDMTGPFDSDNEITFAWRIMDIINAITGSGLAVKRLEEMYAEKDYDQPFMISCKDLMKGVIAAREEVDRMHDWRSNPMAALPNWMSVVAKKQKTWAEIAKEMPAFPDFDVNRKAISGNPRKVEL
jgi:ubiquinone/menaquinone biosynthesis C-methylase UbiE